MDFIIESLYIMNKKIAFDIDGVLTEGKYLPVIERTYENYLKLKPIRAVFDFIVELKEAGFQLYIISSRRLTMNHTCFDDWLKRVDLGVKYSDFEVLLFNTPCNQKAYLAEKLGCAVLVDDSLDVINECDNTSVKGFLFIDQDNRRYKTEDYVKLIGTEKAIVDKYAINPEIKRYFKEAGIVF